MINPSINLLIRVKLVEVIKTGTNYIKPIIKGNKIEIYSKAI